MHVTVKHPLTVNKSVQKISPTRYCAVILFLLIYFYFCEFQIVLQDHNYGADSHTSSVSPEPHSKCGGLNPSAIILQTGQTSKANNGVCYGSPVMECREKCMLASQLRPLKSGDGPGVTGSGISALCPTPRIIFHHFLASGDADNATPVVNGRSYDNEARFVWQSCQPNTEVKSNLT